MWISTPHIPPDFRGPTDRPFTRFGDPASSAPVLERLAAIVQQRGTALAAAHDRDSLSFEHLWQWTLRLARAIEHTRTGTQPVAVLLPGDHTYMVAVFACLAAGRLAVLLDAGYPEGRNHAIIAATGASLIIARPSSLQGPALPATAQRCLDPHAALDEPPIERGDGSAAPRIFLEGPRTRSGRPSRSASRCSWRRAKNLRRVRCRSGDGWAGG